MSHNVGKLIVFLSLIFSLTIFASAQTPDVGIGIKKIEHLSHIRRMH
jgi:hypothetical protein